ncbi:MAG: serine hydrolase domain-containing protein [Gemmatimonadales bacterium]
MHLTALLSIAVLATPAAAQRPTAPAPAEPASAAPADQAAIARARTFIRDTMTALGAPGAGVTVMRAGRVIWSEGFGFADLEQGVPVTPLTRFRVGSVSKSLTSAAVGLLVESGRLDLDAPIQRYVPSFPVKRWPITTRLVAGHLAGIRHYRGENEMVVHRTYPDVTTALDIFAADSLLFEPGTRFSYSSFGYNLLSAVVERAAGEPFLQFMERRVFDAVGLRHTTPDHVDSIVPHRARWYTRGPRGGGIVNAPATDNSYKWAGGGFLSTTEDLVTFGDALLHGRLLKPETVRLLWTSQQLRDGKASGYGIGWFTRKDEQGRLVVFHSGGSVGGTAMLMIYPDQDLIIAVLVNSDSTFVGATATVAGMFLDGR